MTPLGVKLRALRKEKGVTMSQMAEALEVTSAYLSALENGKRGRPTTHRLHQICAYFEIIWDEADGLRRLADISHPKVTIDTSGLSPEATELANRLVEQIGELSEAKIEAMLGTLKR
ncbi:MAG: transcriptional regulator [Rhodospirillaceae bacterium]|nr:transcriptional regulator [Rhodospirillaceae bacterium]OUX30938.1 MAG: transcriptional regulator [Rhodospirillaceae bacterium TMED256]